MAHSVDLEDIRLDSETEATTDVEGTGTDVEAGETEPSPSDKKRKDPSTFNLVEAAQYGVLERCRELVERRKADIAKADSEGITVLHWAAINNRLPVASYFIQKGANVNATGGELKSGPLHWAVRQGHLTMVVLLMRYGADPEVLDGEGLNCLHIAAQYGFTDLVAYFLSCKVPLLIDCRDAEGRTALMVAAARANRSADPTRLLISLGSDLHAVDNNNNNALHHAAESCNYYAVQLLVDAGAPLNNKNKDNKTAHDLAMENQNRYGMDVISTGSQKRRPQGILQYLTRQPRVAWWIQFFGPAVMLGLLGYMGVLCPNWWSYLLATTLLGAIFRKFVFAYIPVFIDSSPLVFGLVVATKFWIYGTLMLTCVRYGTLVHYYLLTAAFVAVNFVFYRAWKSDPGYIPKCSGQYEAFRTISELCERGLFHSDNFCSTCLVRRPLRSKHCKFCNRCVARFDHHCPWIDNCVGLHNHKVFLSYLVSLLLIGTWAAKASLNYIFHFYPADHGNFLVRSYHYVTVDPWLGFILVMCFFHLTWVYLLLMVQIFQMICQGMTTNEKMNAHRYSHFLKFGGSNPFHRGVLANCADFFGFTCCQDRSSKVDWTSTYEIPKNFTTLTSEDDNMSTNVRIPMPYSSTWDPTQDSMKSAGSSLQSNGYVSSDDDGTLKQQFSASKEYNI